MTSRAERRQDPRYAVNGLPGLLTFPSGSEVLNMSISGIGVRTTVPMRIHRRISFRLETGEGEMPLSGTVQWCKLCGRRPREAGGHEPVYEAGIAFDVALSDAEVHSLSALHRNAPAEPERRFHGRYRPASDAAMTLEQEHEFRVKRISLSGLLVETADPVPPDLLGEIHVSLGEASFAAEVRVVSQDEVLSEGRQVLLVGMAFVNLTASQKALIESFIQKQDHQWRADRPGEGLSR